MERGQDDYLFWINAQGIFFQLPNRKQYCLWDPSGSYVPGDKKAQNRSSVAQSTCCIPLHAAMATECDKKTKGAYQY